MIERVVHGDALDASEDMLLVPVPIGETAVEEGFAGQVMRRFPEVKSLLDAKSGLSAGEFVMVGDMGGKATWRPVYSLVLAGIHQRQSRGWELAPVLLEDVLHRINNVYMPDRMATAGIPGTGFSGVRGNANPEQIRQVLDQSQLRVSVYLRGPAGDRAKLLEADPPKEATEAVDIPRVASTVGLNSLRTV